MWKQSENRLTRSAIVLAIVLAGVAVDQFTKKLAIDRNASSPPDTFYCFDLVRVTYAENPGAFLSLGATLGEGYRFWILTGFNSLILLAVTSVLLIRKRLFYLLVVALSMVLSGGLGNLIDRIFRDGRVVDFLVLGMQDMNIPFRTGIINIADVLIMFGLGALLISEFFGPKDKEDISAPAGANSTAEGNKS